MNNRYNTARSEGHASALAIEKITRRTEPTQHLYKGAHYTPASQTDLSKTMAQYRLAFGGKA
jgi:hypothetical protein